MADFGKTVRLKHMKLVFALALAGIAAQTQAQAQSQAQESGRLAHDIYLPIEFSADRLEVIERDRIATFEGNVEAVQGELRLLADIVTVYFEVPDAGSETRPGVSRIDATGHVVLSSPGERASGDWGIYDVNQKIITLGGSVVLNRGTTKIEGTRLVLDLEQGRSRMESSPQDGEDERVRGVFQPAKPADGEPE